jgi:hypothetical protein
MEDLCLFLIFGTRPRFPLGCSAEIQTLILLCCVEANNFATPHPRLTRKREWVPRWSQNHFKIFGLIFLKMLLW